MGAVPFAQPLRIRFRDVTLGKLTIRSDEKNLAMPMTTGAKPSRSGG
jgi:hypothetical protein